MAIEGFGRKLGHIGGHMGITGRESGSPDGTFPFGKSDIFNVGTMRARKNERTDEKS